MRQDQDKRSVHWTQTLFVENAHLYLPFLEQAKEHAPQEVEALAALWDQLGVPRGGRVLDLACGIGRHDVLLSRMGYDVTGLDISPLYVEGAREYAAAANSDARFIVGDALDVADVLAGEHLFDALVNMSTSHSYYGRVGDLKMFGDAAELAADGAILVVGTVNRDYLVRHFEPEGMQSAGNVTIRQTRRLDLETSSMMNTWQFFKGSASSPCLSLELSHRVYSLHELTALLAESGWKYRNGLGAPDSEAKLTPLTVDTSRMWAVAERQSLSRKRGSSYAQR